MPKFMLQQKQEDSSSDIKVTKRVYKLKKQKETEKVKQMQSEWIEQTKRPSTRSGQNTQFLPESIGF